jgi:hypothetical protein
MTNGHSSSAIQDRTKHPICRTRRDSFTPKLIAQDPSTAALRQLPTPRQTPLAFDTHLEKQRNEGAALLKSIEAQLRRFIWLPNDHAYTIVSLWIVYTHAYDLFQHAPRLALHSPVPGCGKSTLFRIVRPLVRSGDIWATPSEATVFRDMAANHPVILFDEMDKYLYRNSGILAVLNAGHMAGVTVPRVVGEGAEAHVEHFDVFGPVAFALKRKELPADLAERSLRVDMQKSPMQLPKLAQADLLSLNSLGTRVAEFAARNRKLIQEAALQPNVPATIINRAGDNWVPLFAIAQAAGEDWPQRVTAAAMDYEKQNASTDSGVLLLRNLKMTIESNSKTFFSSQELCDTLNDREDWPWGEYSHGNGLTPHALARLLKPFGISPAQEKLSGEGKSKVRGYHRHDFEKVWEAYGIQIEPRA